MGTEVNLFYQVLDREIDNLVSTLATRLGYGAFAKPAGEIAKNKAHEYLKPYVQGFTGGDGKVDTDLACEFAKNEAAEKIEAFKAKMNKGG